MSALLDRGVFPVIEAVSIEAAESVMGSAGSSPLRVPVGDQVSPVTVAGGEVGPPLTMPKFEPVSLSSGASPGDRSDWRVKIRLARLQLDAQARQDDLKQQIEMYRIDADTKVRLRQLELQAAQDPPKQTINKTSTCLEGGPEITAGPSNSSISNVSVLADRSVVVPPTYFDVAKNIAIVPPFREKEVEAYFQAFERIASALKWPTEVWALMLQCKLSSKAQEVCASLSLEECSI